MSEQSIEVMRLTEDEDGEGTSCYLARGHVDPIKFCEAINTEFEEKLDSSKVQHGYYRWVPFRDSDCFRSFLYRAASPGPGVFKASIIDV